MVRRVDPGVHGLGVRNGAVEVEDGCGGHVVGLEGGDRLGGGHGLGHRCEVGHEDPVDALGVPGLLQLGDPFGVADRLAGALHLRPLVGGHHHPPVGGGDDRVLADLLLRFDLLVVVDAGAGGEQVGEVEVGGHRQHVDLDPGAGTGPFPLQQGGEHGLGGEHPGELVDGVGPQRLGPALPGVEPGQPGEGLDDGVEGGRLRAGPGVPEAGDRAVDQPGVVGPERLVGEAEPVGHAGPPVLQEDVGPGGEAAELGQRLGVLQVEGPHLLAPVHVDEHRPGALPQLPEAAQRIPFRRLDLDDLGPQVGQGEAGERPGQVHAGIEHGEAFEGKRLGHGHSMPSPTGRRRPLARGCRQWPRVR